MKAELKEYYEIFNSLPLDTMPIRIEENRKKLKLAYLEIEKLDKNILGGKAKEFKELKQLLYEHFHYFDTGYQAPHGIDDLPDLIRKKLEELI